MAGEQRFGGRKLALKSLLQGFPGGSGGKNLRANSGDTARKSSPRSPQLGKSLCSKQRPSTARNKFSKKEFIKISLPATSLIMVAP